MFFRKRRFYFIFDFHFPAIFKLRNRILCKQIKKSVSDFHSFFGMKFFINLSLNSGLVIIVDHLAQMNGISLKQKGSTQSTWMSTAFFQKLIKFDILLHAIMPLLSEYLNLSLMKPFCSQKSKYLTMTCSDVIGTETGEVWLPILEVISVTYKKRFFPGESKIFLL